MMCASDLGQVMNKVQKQRRLSRQGSNQTLTKNKAKLQAAAKAALIDGSLNKHTMSRFQSLKFTVKTLHFVITVRFNSYQMFDPVLSQRNNNCLNYGRG